MSARLAEQLFWEGKLRLANTTLNKPIGEVSRKPLLPNLNHHVVWPFCEPHHTINAGAAYLWKTISVLKFWFNLQPVGEISFFRGNTFSPTNDTKETLNFATGQGGPWPDIIFPADPTALGGAVGALTVPPIGIKGVFDAISLDVLQLDTTGSNQDTFFLYGFRVVSF